MNAPTALIIIDMQKRMCSAGLTPRDNPQAAKVHRMALAKLHREYAQLRNTADVLESLAPAS